MREGAGGATSRSNSPVESGNFRQTRRERLDPVKLRLSCGRDPGDCPQLFLPRARLKLWNWRTKD